MGQHELISLQTSQHGDRPLDGTHQTEKHSGGPTKRAVDPDGWVGIAAPWKTRPQGASTDPGYARGAVPVEENFSRALP